MNNCLIHKINYYYKPYATNECNASTAYSPKIIIYLFFLFSESLFTFLTSNIHYSWIWNFFAGTVFYAVLITHVFFTAPIYCSAAAFQLMITFPIGIFLTFFAWFCILGANYIFTVFISNWQFNTLMCLYCVLPLIWI